MRHLNSQHSSRNSERRRSAGFGKRSAFTMIELLLALSLLSLIIVGGFAAFTTANRVWRVGTEAADSIHHGDFIMEQLSMALRSAYYPDESRPNSTYGMILTNNGDEDEAHDSLSWVKMGSALVGADSEEANSPHRIVVYSVEPGESDLEGFEDGGIAIKSWRISALPEDFDPDDEEFVKPMMLIPGMKALEFKVLNPEKNLAEGKAPQALSASDPIEEDPFEWIDDDWKDDYTNRLPYAVQATLYLPPSEDGGSAIPVSRVITLPLAPLSWRDKGAAGGRKNTDGKNNNNRNVNQNKFNNNNNIQKAGNSGVNNPSPDTNNVRQRSNNKSKASSGAGIPR